MKLINQSFPLFTRASTVLSCCRNIPMTSHQLNGFQRNFLFIEPVCNAEEKLKRSRQELLELGIILENLSWPVEDETNAINNSGYFDRLKTSSKRSAVVKFILNLMLYPLLPPAGEVNECVEFLVKNYTEKRPHGSLKGLTPFEAYTKPNYVLNFSIKMIQARENRIQQNRKMNCESCSKK